MYVLGINYSLDAAAALCKDGHVVAACQEERFRRIKHYRGFPEQAIDFCLKQAGIGMEDVDEVAFFWNPGLHAESFYRGSAAFRHHLDFLFNVPNHLLSRWFDGAGVESFRQEVRLGTGKRLGIEYVTHHLCHAASAFYRSNFDEAAILTVDGYGERASTTIAAGRGTEIETLHTIDFPHSIGSLYAALTQYLGFRANNGEGKVMGLASYGKASEFEEPIAKLVELTDDGFEIDLSYFQYFVERRRRYSKKLTDVLGPERKAGSELTQRHMDIAWALQKRTEEALVHMAKLAREKTGLDRLCMAGGVVLNCVANTRILRESGFSECFFQPCAGDAGTSLGAALAVAHSRGAPRVTHPLTDYLGPGFSDEDIALELKKGGIAAMRVDEPEKVAAKAIHAGRIIGWYQGRTEFGPRALGNRSIVCDPGREDMKDVLNARVKFREPFRPFAPSVAEEACSTYFDDDGVASPFMLLVYDTRPEHVATLPSITHVDGGARVQTVSAEQNPRYHKLITEFGKLSGVSCVLNTSFNIRGEPIVCTPEDALKCFFTTDMDLLFVGKWVVWKDAETLAPLL